jgi:hypothetical protein
MVLWSFIDYFRFAGLRTALVFGTCWAYAIIFCCLGSPAEAAGIQLLDSDPSLAGVIWYPCAGRKAWIHALAGTNDEMPRFNDVPRFGVTHPIEVMHRCGVGRSIKGRPKSLKPKQNALDLLQPEKDARGDYSFNLPNTNT